MADNQRRLIGRSSSLIGRQSLYQTRDAFEIEETEHYEVVRRRVFFEDVVMVTHHRERGAIYLILTGVAALFFVTIALMIVSVSTEAWPAAVVFLLIGLPALIGFVLRLLFGVDVITILGRRSRVSVRFGLRKERAREAYAQIVGTVRGVQQRLARQYASQAPPVVAPPDVPLPPDEPTAE